MNNGLSKSTLSQSIIPNMVLLSYFPCLVAVAMRNCSAKIESKIESIGQESLLLSKNENRNNVWGVATISVPYCAIFHCK